jgi:hypothetical protein
LAAAGLVVTSAFLPWRCTDGRRARTASIGGSLALGIGVSFTIGGTVSFLGVPVSRRRAERVTSERRTALTLAGLAVGMLVGAALALGSVIELAICSST